MLPSRPPLTACAPALPAQSRTMTVGATQKTSIRVTRRPMCASSLNGSYRVLQSASTTAAAPECALHVDPPGGLNVCGLRDEVFHAAVATKCYPPGARNHEEWWTPPVSSPVLEFQRVTDIIGLARSQDVW